MAEMQYCVVCNEGSNRDDWKNKKGDYVACDGHSTREIEEAVKLKESNPKN